VRGTAATLRACSACAGDYEDPDRTAWDAEEKNDEAAVEQEQGTHEDKFPVQEKR
jgi:hypothetical protein